MAKRELRRSAGVENSKRKEPTRYGSVEVSGTQDDRRPPTKHPGPKEEAAGPVERNWTPRDLLTAKHKIIDEITSYIYGTVIVWCPREQLGADVVASMLNRFGTVEQVNNHWSTAAEGSCLGALRGVVAKYETRDMALKAAAKLPTCSRYISAILMGRVLNFLINVEIFHPGFERELTVLRVTINTNFRIAEMQRMMELLRSFGHVTDIRFQNPGRVCEAKFRYFSQACVAFLCLENTIWGCVKLCVDIQKSKMVNDILLEVRDKMEDYADGCRFP